jgi:hypothetical protein
MYSCSMQRTERTGYTIRVSALLLALLVFGLRVASPVLHHHATSSDSAEHLQQDGCPSCDYEATSALSADALVTLPQATLTGSVLPQKHADSFVATPSASRLRGRAPPSFSL